MDEQTMLQIEWNTLDVILQDCMCTAKSLLLLNNPDLTVDTRNFQHDVHGQPMVSKGLFIYDARIGRDVRVAFIPYLDEVLNESRYKISLIPDDLCRSWQSIATNMGFIPGCNWNSQLFVAATAATFRELVSERHLA